MNDARRELAEPIARHRFIQFLFFRQWGELKRHANERGIRLIGDLPIFVSSDSADVWANPDFFHLDEHRQPTVVAGVPPDYFSATGQLWGNPLYNWEALKSDRLPLVARSVRRDAGTGGYGAARSFSRVRGLLGSAGQRDDGDARSLGYWSGRRLFQRRPSASRSVAVDRRGSGPDHAARRCASASVWLAGHAYPAVRFRRGHRRPVPAAQLRTPHRRLHRHSRQRLHARLVRAYDRRRAHSSSSLRGMRRSRSRVGLDSTGVGLGRRSGHRAPARRSGLWAAKRV